VSALKSAWDAALGHSQFVENLRIAEDNRDVDSETLQATFLQLTSVETLLATSRQVQT